MEKINEAYRGFYCSIVRNGSMRNRVKTLSDQFCRGFHPESITGARSGPQMQCGRNRFPACKNSTRRGMVYLFQESAVKQSHESNAGNER